jgi:predicted secreted protein
MNWTSALAIFFIMWFFCLFLVLPFHARSAGKGEGTSVPGEDKGAPARFDAGRAALQITLLTSLLFGLYYANYTQGWITRDSFTFLPQPPDR